MVRDRSGTWFRPVLTSWVATARGGSRQPTEAGWGEMPPHRGPEAKNLTAAATSGGDPGGQNRPEPCSRTIPNYSSMFIYRLGTSRAPVHAGSGVVQVS